MVMRMMQQQQQRQQGMGGVNPQQLMGGGGINPAALMCGGGMSGMGGGGRYERDGEHGHERSVTRDAA